LPPLTIPSLTIPFLFLPLAFSFSLLSFSLPSLSVPPVPPCFHLFTLEWESPADRLTAVRRISSTPSRKDLRCSGPLRLLGIRIDRVECVVGVECCDQFGQHPLATLGVLRCHVMLLGGVDLEIEQLHVATI